MTPSVRFGLSVMLFWCGFFAAFYIHFRCSIFIRSHFFGLFVFPAMCDTAYDSVCLNHLWSRWMHAKMNGQCVAVQCETTEQWNIQSAIMNVLTWRTNVGCEIIFEHIVLFFIVSLSLFPLIHHKCSCNRIIWCVRNKIKPTRYNTPTAKWEMNSVI